jgi:tetratricopeptide (TPR) repeat protein
MHSALEKQKIDEHLLNGIAAVRAGRRSEARTLLMSVVERDERNEQAWLWLAGVMDDPADVRTCLENVLELNPNNARARQGLDWLSAQTLRSAERDERAEQAAGAAQEDQQPRTEDHRPPTDDRPPATKQSRTAATTAPPTPDHTVNVSSQESTPTTQNSRLKSQSSNLADLPCPYCGAPTSVRQRSCTQCRNSLMIQAEPSERPSRWLGALGVVLGAAGLLVVIGGIAYAVAAVLAYQAARFGPDGQQIANAPLPLALITISATLIVLGVNIAGIAGPLRRRSLPAYYAVVIGLPLLMALTAFAWLRGLPAISLTTLPAESATLLADGLGSALVVLLGLLVLCAALAGMAYRDFFGPIVRFTGRIEPADATTHYNSGVSYRKRGMWYMAAGEWERAAALTPRDINVLRALGLAYAQLGQRQAALDTLDRALAIAPDHTGLREDRAAVER